MLSKLKTKKLLILIDQMLVSGSNFVLGILLARYLGVVGYGQFALLWLIVLFFSSLQLAYIVSPMLTLGSKKSSFILDRYLSTMMFLQVMFTVVAIISLYFFLEVAVFFDEKWNMGDLKIYILFTTLFFLSQDFLRRYFIIKAQYYSLLIIDAIAYLGQLGMLVYFIYNNNLDLSTALLAVAIPFLSALLVGYTQVTRVTTNMQYKRLIFFKNWKFSKWLVYSSLLQWGSGNFYILAGGAILGSWAVGVIRIMQNTMGVFNIIFLSLENLLPITFSKIYNKQENSTLINYSKKLVFFGVMTSFILLVIVYAFSVEIISLIYGKEYIEYSYLLIAYVGIYLFIYLSLLLRNILKTLEYTKYIFKVNIIIFIVNIIIVFPLLTIYSINGIVIGIYISHITYIIYLYSRLNSYGVLLNEKK